jgi:Xaa-Pro dipeptidase
MANGFLDRRRAERLMREADVDALVLAQPETIRYATGAFAGVASFWRRAGAAFVIVPADADLPLVAIVGDLQAAAFREASGIADVRTHPLWVETTRFEGGSEGAAAAIVARDLREGRKAGASRPAGYDRAAVFGLLRDAIGEQGLLKSALGLELGFIPAADFPLFEQALPAARLVDCTRIVERLRAIKSAKEIAMLRSAAELASAGVQTLLRALRPGLDARAMTEIWRQAHRAEAARRKIRLAELDWAYIAVGGDGFAPGAPAAIGDLVKIDVGCVFSGYSSDGARTAVIGRPSRAQRDVYDALRRGFDAGLEALRPGVPLARVYGIVARTIQDAGFLTYARGHFGHGVGASVWSEEWPFISADSTAVAEPNMVLAFETPYYIDGLGGFIIEDQLLIGDASAEVMAPSSRDLYEAISAAST